MGTWGVVTGNVCMQKRLSTVEVYASGGGNGVGHGNGESPAGSCGRRWDNGIVMCGSEAESRLPSSGGSARGRTPRTQYSFKTRAAVAARSSACPSSPS